jgi:hypothetical protein
MAIRLYNPGTKTFVAADPNIPFPSDQAQLGRIMLNVLIELQVQTNLLSAMVQGQTVNDDPDAMRADVVQQFPVTG